MHTNINIPCMYIFDRYEFMLKCWTYKPEDRIVGLEELKIMCAKSLMLFVEHGTAEDSVSILKLI